MARLGHKKGDYKRTVRCNFCGGEHRRRSKELRECRRRRGKPAGESSTDSADSKSKVDYDSLGGNPRAHLVIRRVKNGWPVPKIAKQMDLSIKEVKRIKREAGL